MVWPCLPSWEHLPISWTGLPRASFPFASVTAQMFRVGGPLPCVSLICLCILSPPSKPSSVSVPVDGSHASPLGQIQLLVLPRIGLLLPFKPWLPTRYSPVKAGTTSHSAPGCQLLVGAATMSMLSALDPARDAKCCHLCGESSCRLASLRSRL